MAEATIDDSMWPLVVVTFAESSTVAETDALFDKLRGFLKRRDRFAVVLDARRVRTIDALKRKAYGDFLASIDGFDRFVAAAAVIVDEEIQRGLLTAILWIHKPHFPIDRFEGLGEAMIWAREKVREREEVARRSGFPSAPPPPLSQPRTSSSMRMPAVSAAPVPSPPSSSHMRSVPAVPYVPSTSPGASSVPPPPPSRASVRMQAVKPGFPPKS